METTLSHLVQCKNAIWCSRGDCAFLYAEDSGGTAWPENRDSGFQPSQHVLSCPSCHHIWMFLLSFPPSLPSLTIGRTFKSPRLNLVPATSAKSKCLKMTLMKFWAPCVQDNEWEVIAFKLQCWVILKPVQNFRRQELFKKSNHEYVLGAFPLPSQGWSIN